MAPVDSTPDLKTGNFEILYSSKAYDKVPVTEFKSKKTGLTVVIAEVDGPMVNGYFCLVTEALDDDGLPHTLEHLIFLGSEEYPYKGVLDLLANRCLASGTNAWTDIDHTCYTMEVVGSEGFLSLMPIYLDHILYPILSEEGFITEVHHITGDGEDAGIVYCEIQARENSAESLIHINMARSMYPGRCGYSSDTGGVMKNLRETTTNEKIKNYHKEFYRPENLKIIITGQIKPEDVFRAIAPLEDKIVAKGERTPFTRPWQNPVPPLLESKHLVVKYPADEEINGIFSIAWRGPSAVKDVYTLSAASIMLKYLTDLSVSPLQKKFVEIPDPYASTINYGLSENSESCLYIMFENVPLEKLPEIKDKLLETLREIVDNEDIDMERMKNVINRHRLESLSAMEENPHYTIAFMVIGHMLYGNTKEDMEQRINPLVDLKKIDQEPKSYWVSLLKNYFVEAKMISIEGVPSVEEQQRLAAEEKTRINEQIKRLGKEGLKKKAEEVENAIEFNERPAPQSMLTCVPIPSTKSINFHKIIRHRTDLDEKKLIDLSSVPIFTYFDHIETNFVYMFALMDTSSISSDLRLYIPLLLEILFESPIKRGVDIISYETVVTELNNDTIACGGQIGLRGSKRFTCGSYGHTVSIMLQVENSKYEKGISWLREILYQTVFTIDRLKIIAKKIINEVAQVKRSGKLVLMYVMKALTYVDDSNQQANGIIKQHKFLTSILEQLDTDKADDVLKSLEKLRQILVDPKNLTLYFAGDLLQLKPTASKTIFEVLPEEIRRERKELRSLNVTPDWKLMSPTPLNGISNCIVGLGSTESSYFYQTVPTVNSKTHPDFPALLLFSKYLSQMEGPLWKNIRGKGYSYNYAIYLKISEGLLYLVFAKATNIVSAYKESREIILKQISEKVWDNTFLESAKTSLIYDIVKEEQTPSKAVALSLNSYFEEIDYEYNRILLERIENVTVEDLNRVGEKYFSELLSSTKIITVVVCDPAKAEDIKAGFQKLNLDLEVYPSLEESFLNK